MPANKLWHWRPLTPALWGDFERLFGPKGAYGGCWCMWWRITRGQFEQLQGEGNRQAMQNIVESGEVPGILLYDDGDPVGWCSVAPRDRFAALQRSRVLKPIDDTPGLVYRLCLCGPWATPPGCAAKADCRRSGIRRRKRSYCNRGLSHPPQKGPPAAGVQFHGHTGGVRAAGLRGMPAAFDGQGDHAL